MGDRLGLLGQAKAGDAVEGHSSGQGHGLGAGAEVHRARGRAAGHGLSSMKAVRVVRCKVTQCPRAGARGCQVACPTAGLGQTGPGGMGGELEARETMSVGGVLPSTKVKGQAVILQLFHRFPVWEKAGRDWEYQSPVCLSPHALTERAGLGGQH